MRFLLFLGRFGTFDDVGKRWVVRLKLGCLVEIWRCNWWELDSRVGVCRLLSSGRSVGKICGGFLFVLYDVLGIVLLARSFRIFRDSTGGVGGQV